MKQALDEHAIEPKQEENIQKKYETLISSFYEARIEMVDKYRILLLALSLILCFLFWEIFVPNEDNEDAPTMEVEV